MSRSNNADLKNPAAQFFKWLGSGGQLSWWDKEAKENVNVPLPFQFMILDKLVTIAGYSDEDKSGIWSNEIRNTRDEILTVRTKNGIKREGLYGDVKSVTGAKFCQSVYIAYYDENKQLTIGNLKLWGCAVSSWIEFAKGKDIYKGAIGITGSTEGKKGATTYFSPVFEQKENVSPDANIKAMELDGVLQEYLNSYFLMRGRKTEAETPEDYIDKRNREIEDYEADESAHSGEGLAFAHAAADYVKDNPHGSTYGNHVQPELEDVPF